MGINPNMSPGNIGVNPNMSPGNLSAMSPMSAMMSPGLNHVMSPGVTSSLVGGASAMSPAYPPGESSAPQAPVGTNTGAAAPADEMEDEPYICRWIDCGMVFKVRH